MPINAKYRIPNKETKEKEIYHFQTNVDQVVGLGLQRKKEYAAGDIAYAMGLPSSLCLECVTPGTTGSESPDFSGKKAGDTLEDGTAVFVINKKSNATYAATATKAEQLTTARTIDGVNFNGTGNIVHYGSCSTAAATAEKAVACAGFVLAAGAKIAVKFTVTNTAANPTLNVQSTGAKPVYYRGAAISAGYLAANRTYEFVYNGTQYELIGDLDTNSNMTQNISSANATYPVLLCPTANATANQGAKTGIFASNVKVNPSTGSLTAKGLIVSATDSNAEGGEISLNASKNTLTGTTIDNYNGYLRIFGIPSADGTTQKGNGTALKIDPYAKTITGNYTFSGALSGNASSASKISGKTICVVSSFDASTGTLNLTSLS